MIRDGIGPLLCLLGTAFAVLASCTENMSPENTNPTNTTLFELLPPEQTGVGFHNTIAESDTLNILRQANLYNGGGVGIGDFNKDGFVDVYLAGNTVANTLYLNQGQVEPLTFKDVTEIAGVDGADRWCTGIAVVDINTDGWLDLYVSASFLEDPPLRQNLLYINQGVNEAGIPLFQESAEAYGLADTGFSTQGYFFPTTIRMGTWICTN